MNATPHDLYKAVTKITDTIDGDGGAANDDDIYEKRNLHSSVTMDGVRGSWFLDREGGETVNAALDAQMETARIDDDPAPPPNGAPTRSWTSAGTPSPSGSTHPRRPNAGAVSPTRSWCVDIRMFEQHRRRVRRRHPRRIRHRRNPLPQRRSNGSCATATSAA